MLNEGDTVSVDLGVLYKGYYGDGARTYAVGRIDEADAKLLRVTRGEDISVTSWVTVRRPSTRRLADGLLRLKLGIRQPDSSKPAK